MNSIRIKHDGDLGRHEEPEYPVTASEIHFRNMHVKEVDLSNLTSCKNLQSLDLSHNPLERIDLRALADCPKLQRLVACDNRLQSLDLWPLVGNRELNEVRFFTNSNLRKLDVTPVLVRAKLTVDASVVLYSDLILHWVLTRKERERQIHLVRSDGVSWSGFPIIIWNSYDSFSQEAWGVTRGRIESVLEQIPQEKSFAAQRGIMVGLGLGELSGYDGNPRSLLARTTDGMTYSEDVERIHEHVLDLLEHQISRGGSTLFLDAELMKRTGASRLLPIMVEQRKREIDEIRIPKRGSKVYLRGLWLTHYGFEILSVLGLGLRTDLQGLNQIEACFSNLGFELVVDDSPDSRANGSVNTSSSLQRHVCHLALGHYDSTLPM